MPQLIDNVNWRVPRVLALDPATKYTGYAYFTKPERGLDGFIGLRQYGLIRAKEKTWDMRCLEIQSRIRNFIVTMNLTHLVMEYPQFEASRRGMAAARGGDILKLAYLCGCISTGWQLHVAEVMKRKVMLPLASLVTPNQWKGQTPKHVTAFRCFQKFHIAQEKGVDDNFIDAVMIGHFWLLQGEGFRIDYDEGARREDLNI